MPPLRERGDDVLEIARAALARYGAEEGRRFDGFAPEVEALFRAHPWPGNVRQLLNVIRNIAVLNPGGTVNAAMLPETLAGEPAPPRRAAAGTAAPGGDPLAGLTLAEAERRVVMAALERHDGSVPRAARELDVAPSTIYRKLAAWGVAA